jgi:hypothetical protein
MWMLANISYGGKLKSCFGYDRTGSNAQGRTARDKAEVLTTNYPIKAPDKAYDKPYNTKPDTYVGAS